MRKILIFLLFVSTYCFPQKSDFAHINFSKADSIAKSVKAKRLYDLNKITFSLTDNLDTDVEKLRAIYTWICTNVANDFRLYSSNERKRKKYVNDSIQLENWNSEFKKILFKKLYKRKKTICTGYAYLLKEMCNLVGIESKMINGFGKTASTDFSELPMPNHTWNSVKINNKWYLCDPTWSTGISFPEDGTFKFNYNDGYFLANPEIFNLNHFALEREFSLLENPPSFAEFDSFPIIYGEAYNYLDKHIAPLEIYNEVSKNETFTFKYKLAKTINFNKIKFIAYNGFNERIIKPIVSHKNNELTLKHKFISTGFYDLHLYIEENLIASYSFQINKQKL